MLEAQYEKDEYSVKSKVMLGSREGYGPESGPKVRMIGQKWATLKNMA